MPENLRRSRGSFRAFEGAQQACRNGEGFTFIELTLVILILGIIAGMFVGTFQEGNRMFDTVDARKELTQEGRMALLRIVREIRQVRSSSDVLTADANNFSFYGVGDSLFAIQFSGTSGDDITFRRGASQEKIAGYVDSLAFGYYKPDGNEAAPLVSPSETDIYRISIFLRLNKNGVKVSLKTGTQLRNL